MSSNSVFAVRSLTLAFILALKGIGSRRYLLKLSVVVKEWPVSKILIIPSRLQGAHTTKAHWSLSLPSDLRTASRNIKELQMQKVRRVKRQTMSHLSFGAG